MQLRKQKGKETVEININSSEDDDEKSVENDLVGHLDDVDLKEVKLQQLEEGITKLNSEQKFVWSYFTCKTKVMWKLLKLQDMN